MRKKLFLILIIFITLLLLVSCGPDKVEGFQGEGFQYEILDPDSFKEDELKQWYEESYKEPFSQSIRLNDGYRYLLICAGEIGARGFSIEVIKTMRNEKGIVFFTKLIEAEGGHASGEITYPKLLLRFKEEEAPDGRAELDLSILEEKNTLVINDSSNNLEGENIADSSRETGEMKGVNNKDTQEEWIEGEYMGLMDSHSVEVIVNTTAQAFQLADDVKEYITAKGVESGKKVRLRIEREGRELIITKMTILPTP